ncbi:MAG: ABC transporter ATP-binding protein [Candidatus Nanopelagicales bacterium]
MRLSCTFAVAPRALNVELDLAAGSTLAVIGPNGAGKSTVLHVLAGLLRPSQGHAHLGNRLLFDTATGVDLPAHKRGVALLAQDPCLFPRMTAAGNVAFAVRARRGADPQGQAHLWLSTTHAATLAARRPDSLSGGQAQRVAIARALAAEPDLLLLDEPLAALDQPVAAEIRQTLREVLAGRTAVVVTHEILDAALLADHIAVMQEGRIMEHGPAEQVLHRPRTPFAAQVCGLNLLAGTPLGQAGIATALGPVAGVAVSELTGPSVATFRPASVSVHRQRPEGSPRNVFEGAVDEIVPQGQLVRIRVGEVAADVTPAAVTALRLAVGEHVFLATKAAEVSLYPA